MGVIHWGTWVQALQYFGSPKPYGKDPKRDANYSCEYLTGRLVYNRHHQSKDGYDCGTEGLWAIGTRVLFGCSEGPLGRV